jgi:putative membrane protein
VAIVALFAGYVRATRAEERRASPRQFFCFTLGTLALLVAVTWPLGDLAAHWSLLALVVQRLLLMLAVPPLLVTGTPRALLTALTRPAPVDALLRVAVRPVPAIAFVTVVAVGTLTTPAVSWATSSASARVVFQLIVLVAGFVLWAPVLTHLPGTRHLSALARGGYLIVQSIVPSFLSVVWIFARRPLYPAYSHSTVAGMSPVLDQQLAGFAAKLTTIVVLWTVAFIIMSRAKVMDGDEEETEPLIWSDVEREIERADRRDRWAKWMPPSAEPTE